MCRCLSAFLAPVVTAQRPGAVASTQTARLATLQVRSSGLPAIFVFIAPPSMEELERRLRGRGTEAPEQVETRLKNAYAEMARCAERAGGGGSPQHSVRVVCFAQQRRLPSSLQPAPGPALGTRSFTNFFLALLPRAASRRLGCMTW